MPAPNYPKKRYQLENILTCFTTRQNYRKLFIIDIQYTLLDLSLRAPNIKRRLTRFIHTSDVYDMISAIPVVAWRDCINYMLLITEDQL